MTKQQLSAEFDKKFNELRNLDKFNIANESKLVEFGFKVKRGDEIFSIVDFGNIKSFFFSQIDKILDEIVPEEDTQRGEHGEITTKSAYWNSSRSEIINNIKKFNV